MSDTSWRGLQSCFEPQNSSWSCLEMKESEYIHPLCRRSLSARSLELCTENLGCETGTHDFSSSDDDDSEDFSLSTARSSYPRLSRSTSLGCGKPRSGAEMGGRNFPPPLTSISGEDCIRVRSCREGGRLVLKAVSVPSSQIYFRAERSDGRLTLRFLHTPALKPEPELEDEKEMVEENAVEDNGVEVEEESGTVEEDEQEAEDDEEEEIEDEAVEKGMNLSENGGGCEVGVLEKFKRPSRCKESGHGSKDWWRMERLCVASS